jgi:hypothetical protein
VVLGRWNSAPRAWIGLLGTLLLIAALLAPFVRMTTANAASGPTGERVGLSGGHDMLWQNDLERQGELDVARASGAGWLAVDIDWASIQTGPFTFNWNATDTVILQAHQRGLKVLGVIAYSPAWARPADCPPNDTHCLPMKAEWFGQFAKIAAARYGHLSSIVALRGAVSAWQVWNEPNHYPFVQTPDPKFYTAMLRQTYLQVKSVDPFATVIAGGTAPAPDVAGRDMQPATFLNTLYWFGAKGFFDAFGHHPYSFPCSPLTPESWNAFQQTLTLRWIMAVQGDGAKKIWATETGAPTGADVGQCARANGQSVTERDQAVFALQYITQWTRTWGDFTGPLFWFSVRDHGTNPMEYDDHFGLLRRNFSQKPAYEMFRALMAQ